ncbi:MAG TPA: alkaline phosphatase family protein [Vicinamibacterales bacterium]|nr:alkaline phosphatase family protein [Vicinamibacterales bacterium]
MAGDQRPSVPVEDLREQLRALGYLDARVDRFVLGRTSFSTWGASLRIGALAGALLGPAAAVGLSARVPGLVTGVADAIVLAFYLAVLLGAGSAVLAFIATLAAGALARRAASRADFAVRARRAAMLAGLLVAGVCLLYLTLWWRATTLPSAPLGSVSAQLFVLAIAVAISVLIGHTVTVTVLASLVRFGLAGSLQRGSPLSSWRVLLPVSAVALVGAFTLLIVTAPTEAPAHPPPPLAVVPTGLHVVVIAIDGIDVATLDLLNAAALTPTLASLTSQVRAPLANDLDRDPARVWTTIATAQPPERHGIRALEARQVAGVEGRLLAQSPALRLLTTATDVMRLTRPAIASSQERVVPTFWEVAATAGLRTAVVHWWATWPAAEDQGIVISDRAILRLEQGGAPAGEIAPVSLYEPLLKEKDARHLRLAMAAAHEWPADLADDILKTLRRSAELDAMVLDLAADPALGPLDLLTVYLPGLDIAQHALLQSADSDAAPLAPSAMADRVRGLESYYTFLDGTLTRWLAGLPSANRQVVLVLQPGRVQQPSPGLLALSGDGATNGLLAQVPPTTVAPTILTALGVPIATDLAGTATRSMFTDLFQTGFPPRTVATYGERRRPGQIRTGKPLDQEMIERMRSLGYVR